MMRVLRIVAVLAAVCGTLYVMAELTQNRPDEVRAGSRTTVSFTISTRDVQRGEPAAAAALWAVCAGTVGGEVSAPVQVAGRWQVTIEPAIGEHGRRRLVGCLEDVTIDRVVGHVVDVTAS